MTPQPGQACRGVKTIELLELRPEKKNRIERVSLKITLLQGRSMRILFLYYKMLLQSYTPTRSLTTSQPVQNHRSNPKSQPSVTLSQQQVPQKEEAKHKCQKRAKKTTSAPSGKPFHLSEAPSHSLSRVIEAAAHTFQKDILLADLCPNIQSEMPHIINTVAEAVDGAAIRILKALGLGVSVELD